MEIVFYTFLTMAAIFVIFNIVDFIKWYWNIIQIVPKKIWELILKIFKKR